MNADETQVYHTIVWLIWLVAALVPALLTRNPLYLTVLLLAVAVLYKALGRSSPEAASWGLFLKAGLFLIAISALLNPLLSHYGQTILFTLPRLSIGIGGSVLLDMGGRITLEALSYGLAGGLSLMVILMIFATFNLLVSHHRLLRSIPSFLYQTGIVLSIAITFVPQMAKGLRDIREAQMIRGHRFRGLRDLLPLFVPLLTTGLERTIQLAESMEARGFGENDASSPGRETFYKASIALALFGFLAGIFWLNYFPGQRLAGAAFIGGGTILLAGTFHSLGRRVRRSFYRRELWRRRDSVVCAISILALIGFLVARLLEKNAFAFYPYPRLTVPTYNPLLGLIFMAPVAPLLFISHIEH